MNLMNRIKGTRNAFSVARSFGVSVGMAAVLAARYLVTGRTGRYRIRPFA
ncbi:hypothetical protein [Polaromonas sp.]